jgi:hypothetical protein
MCVGHDISICTCSFPTLPSTIVIPRDSHPCISSSLSRSAIRFVNISYRYFVIHTI